MVGDLMLEDGSEDGAVVDEEAIKTCSSPDADSRSSSGRANLKTVVVVTSDVLEQAAKKVMEAENVDREEALRLLFLRRAVLPLPGYDIKYAPNMTEFYTQLLQKDELSLDPEVWKNKSYPAMSLRGDYRRMLAVSSSTYR